MICGRTHQAGQCDSASGSVEAAVINERRKLYGLTKKERKQNENPVLVPDELGLEDIT